MKLLVPVGAAVMALGVAVGAQDSTVKSRTEVKADDAKVTVMRGCLMQDVAGGFSLKGTIASGDSVTTTTKTETDRDRDEVSVRAESRTRVDDGAVGTSGTVMTYALTPRAGVDLLAHAGKSVELTAVKVERGRGDAEVTITERTNVDPEGKPDTSARTKTEIELPRSSAGSYTVMSVKQVPGGC